MAQAHAQNLWDRWLVSRGSGLGHGGIASEGGQGTGGARTRALGATGPAVACAETPLCREREGDRAGGERERGRLSVAARAWEWQGGRLRRGIGSLGHFGYAEGGWGGAYGAR